MAYQKHAPGAPMGFHEYSLIGFVMLEKNSSTKLSKTSFQGRPLIQYQITSYWIIVQ